MHIAILGFLLHIAILGFLLHIAILSFLLHIAILGFHIDIGVHIADRLDHLNIFLDITDEATSHFYLAAGLHVNIVSEPFPFLLKKKHLL